MASAVRRISKSTVDWTAFATKVPPNQMDGYKTIKALTESYVNRVHKYPENLPKIDFAMYRNRLGSLAMIDRFEKSYGGVEVPYPKDKSNRLKEISEQEKEAAEDTRRINFECKEVISKADVVMERLKLLPPVEEMTLEMYYYYFPDEEIDFDTKGMPDEDKYDY